MIIVRQGGFEQRDVLEFVDIFFDRLSRECGLGAARFLRGGGQPLFEFLVETNGKHGGAPSLYMYSEGGFSARSAGLRGAQVPGTDAEASRPSPSGAARMSRVAVPLSTTLDRKSTRLNSSH